MNDSVKEQGVLLGIFIVCQQCQGKGTYIHPNIDGIDTERRCGNCRARGIVLSNLGKLMCLFFKDEMGRLHVQDAMKARQWDAVMGVK